MRQSVEYKTNDLTTAIGCKELEQAAERGDNLRISNDHGALQVEKSLASADAATPAVS